MKQLFIEDKAIWQPCKRLLALGEVLLATGWGKTADTSGSSSVLKQNNFTVIPDDVCRLKS